MSIVLELLALADLTILTDDIDLDTANVFIENRLLLFFLLWLLVRSIFALLLLSASCLRLIGICGFRLFCCRLDWSLFGLLSFFWLICLFLLLFLFFR